MADCRPGHPRARDHAQPRCPLAGVVARQRPGQGRHAGRDRRSLQPARQEEHPHCSPHQVSKIQPGQQPGHPVRRHDQGEPMGWIEDAVQWIGENRETKSLKGIPARQFSAQQRIAHKPARREHPVSDIAAKDNAPQEDGEIDHTQDGHSHKQQTPRARLGSFAIRRRGHADLRLRPCARASPTRASSDTRVTAAPARKPGGLYCMMM